MAMKTRPETIVRAVNDCLPNGWVISGPTGRDNWWACSADKPSGRHIGTGGVTPREAVWAAIRAVAVDDEMRLQEETYLQEKVARFKRDFGSAPKLSVIADGTKGMRRGE